MEKHIIFNSILDLDQQKMIERFKNFAQRKRMPYPLYYERYSPIFKTFLDFKTVNLNSTYAIDNLKYSGFTRDINLILNKNEVKFDINIPDAIYRGEQFMIDIYASSATTQKPINIDIECEHVEDNNEQP